MSWQLIIFALLAIPPSVLATGWDDFTDDLATDLAPLISLFGDRLSKQYLSESISILDSFIFAVSPLGILTAVIAVIRVCGNASLKAFVGRAQEGPGEAENELLSCVSESTAELFNDGGVSRVLGRPRVLEVVVWEEVDPQTQQRVRRIGTLHDALQTGAWVAGKGRRILDEKEYLAELDIANLSLNKGIARRSQGWFYSAAALGFVLQVGVLVYSAITVFLFPDQFEKDGNRVVSYAFPLFFMGSMLLSIGMFFCAFIIERSSTKCYIRPTTPSKIYWLQPGDQDVGDQVFGAFLAVNEGPGAEATTDIMYIKSVRSSQNPGKEPLLVFTVVTTVVGFVTQFVGFRGLHASVILAQVGSTFLMSIVRASLRTKRTGPEENRFSNRERQLVSHKKQELDFFTFHLEDIQAFDLVANPTAARQPSSSTHQSSGTQSPARINGPGIRAIQTRTRLAQLTSEGSHESMDWDDLPIRKVARSLAKTITETMNLFSDWKHINEDTHSFDLLIQSQAPGGNSYSSYETYSVTLKRSEDTLQWQVDVAVLEAVLGLWTWSLIKADSRWLRTRLVRAVGLTESEASQEETDLMFHKWIHRHTEAHMVPSKTVAFHNRLFGISPDKETISKDILVVQTDNKVETMAAQDIYIRFLQNALRDATELGGRVEVREGSQNKFVTFSDRVDLLVTCFAEAGLGSREDALLCAIPTLKLLLPKLAADSDSVRTKIERLISDADWKGAFSVARWLCERCEGEELERCVFELGYLCQRAISHSDIVVREAGFDEVRSLLQFDARAKFYEGLSRRSNWMNSTDHQAWWSRFSHQLGWIVWHILKNKASNHSMIPALEALGASKDLDLQPISPSNTLHTAQNNVSGGSASGSSGSSQDLTQSQSLERDEKFLAKETILGWLTHGMDIIFERQVPGEEDRLCLQWAYQNAQNALAHWILIKWTEVGQEYGALMQKAFVFAAECNADSSIKSLIRQGADINTREFEGYSPLIEVVGSASMEGTRALLLNGADANLSSKSNKMTPLSMAVIRGDCQLTQLLLDFGANPDAKDDLGFSALHTAVRHNQLSITQLLLDKGRGDIETVCADGRTPLIYAAADNYEGMVELLLAHGANVNAQDDSGSTPLMTAIWYNASERVVRLLLGKKPNIHQKDDNGMTVFDHARDKGCSALLSLLETETREDQNRGK